MQKHIPAQDMTFFFKKIFKELAQENPEYISLWVSLINAISLPVTPNTNCDIWPSSYNYYPLNNQKP